jgi:competence protein ComEC
VRQLADPLKVLEAARGSLLPWAPVFLSFGIGWYFLLPVEPGLPVWLGLGLALAVCLLLAFRGPPLWQIPSMAVALVLAGLLLSVWRAHSVAAPVLTFRYYGPVEGRIIDIDRSYSDQPRITLDEVVLARTAPERTPAQIRIALHGDAEAAQLEPGLRVMLTAHVSPPEGPTEPGGFDFQRLAWYSQLGGVGYSRTPMMTLGPPDDSLGLFAFRLRMRLSRGMQAAIPGQSGAFASALMTGDRSAVSAATNAALRGANLSHLISISGLHMGLLTGFVFGTVRYGLALVPPLALRLNTRKLAALIALGAAIFYLMLAGPNVATRRSFIMAAVMLLAVLADRRAISLRSIAIAALVVLILEPESLVEPGFQMSFGATVALIVAFEPWAKIQTRIPKLLRPPAMLVMSSLAAGMATAPIAAVHFNRIAEYGLLANFISVPLMGIVVMPAGVIAGVLALVGLEAPALWIMGQGTDVILRVASFVANLKGAVQAVPTPPDFVLPVLATGGIAAMIARPLWLRGTGAAVALAALIGWAGADRPPLLIAGDGGLVGLLSDRGRILSKPKGAGFVAQSWLEDDGDLTVQEEAFGRGGGSAGKGAWQGMFGGHALHHLTGKTAPDRAVQLCATADPGTIVVLNGDWPEGADRHGCDVFDLKRLRRSGALAVRLEGDRLAITEARTSAGERPWNTAPRAAWRRQIAAAQ